jgi:hypothetical protein
MSASKPQRPQHLEIKPRFEVIERTPDPNVMNWAMNRYCEWLIRRYMQQRDSQPLEKNGRL